jgi:hypothetical protein
MVAKQSDILRELAAKQSGSSISGILTEETDGLRDEMRAQSLPSDKLLHEGHMAGDLEGLAILPQSDYSINLSGSGDELELRPSQNTWRILLRTGFNKIAITAVPSESGIDDIRHHYPLSHDYLIDELYDRLLFASSSFDQVVADQIFIFHDIPNDEELWKSPFDCINSQASQGAEREISLLAGLPRSDIAELKSRLTDLLEYSQEQPGIRVMSPESVRAFRQFLQEHPMVFSPTLFLADSGALRAQWTRDASHALSVLFQPSGIAEYVMFAPDRRRPSITVDNAGSASWQSVIPGLTKIARLDWLYKE